MRISDWSSDVCSSDLLGRHHPRLHRGVRALDTRHVEEAGAVADQRTAGESELRHRLEPAIADRARTIGHALGTLQYLRDLGVRLPLLHLLEGGDVRVAIVRSEEPRLNSSHYCDARMSSSA